MVLLNSVRGAGILAATRDQDARPYTTRAREAAEHCLHLVHDLGANGFFTSIAATARHLEGEGLYHWMGEAGCRREYRVRGARITPDGWGRYLTPEGDVVFLLEWDRATEFPKQLETKVSGYVTHYRGRERAERNNVPFVAAGARRDDPSRRALPNPRRARRACPRGTALRPLPHSRRTHPRPRAAARPQLSPGSLDPVRRREGQKPEPQDLQAYPGPGRPRLDDARQRTRPLPRRRRHGRDGTLFVQDGDRPDRHR